MKHSILDGTRRADLSSPGPVRTPRRALVRDFMSRPAVAVTPDTDFATMVVAVTASRRGVLPVVVDNDRVVGVVAASDLLAGYDRAATGDPPTAIAARDLMTTPAVVVAEDQPVAEAVRIARRESIHHLPVVGADGRLVGLLSPYDALDALRREDGAIHDEVLTLALTPGSGVVPNSLHVRCERGTVLLIGRTRTRSDAAALCMAVSRIEGLAGLVDRLRWDVDDSAESPDPGIGR